jgi:hypothetical protein
VGAGVSVVVGGATAWVVVVVGGATSATHVSVPGADSCIPVGHQQADAVEASARGAAMVIVTAVAASSRDRTGRVMCTMVGASLPAHPFQVVRRSCVSG